VVSGLLDGAARREGERRPNLPPLSVLLRTVIVWLWRMEGGVRKGAKSGTDVGGSGRMERRRGPCRCMSVSVS
jgi:hypothetical protein